MKALTLLLGLALLFSACTTSNISSFEECEAAGFDIMESYPRQCNDGKTTWVEEIEWQWNEDGVILMQNEDTGEFACFGCNDELCVDPAPVMKPVDESRERHCSYDFEVLERFTGACTREYVPVCGEVQVQCITTPCDPIKTTFSNRCEAEKAGAKNIVEGACVDEEPNPEGACLSFDGNWIEESRECEGMAQSMCEELGGTFNECASACRNNPDAEICTLQCVQVCEFK